MRSESRSKVVILSLLAIAALAAAAPSLAGLFPWTFTYQGQLLDSGVPKNGNADLVFKLFDAASGGNQAGITITANAVPLADGRFTIELDFTNGGVIPGVFDGNDRWLEISVNGTLLTPREKLTATPHAIFARELALPCQQRTTASTALEFVSDSDAGQERIIHSVTNSTKIGAQAIAGEALGAGNVENVGVYGKSISGNGFGLLGENTSTTGNCAGIYGVSQSNAGSGVYGRANAATGTTYGVYGQAVSPTGYGLYSAGALGVNTAGAPQATLQVTGALPATGLALNVDNLLYARSSSAFVGIGRTLPLTSAEFFGVNAPEVGNNYGGMYVNTTDASGMPFYGYASGSSVRAWTYYDSPSSTWKLYINGNRLFVDGVNGWMGIGRQATANALEVEGSASKTTAGSWLANSDARIKTDIRTVVHALDTLDRVRLVDFRYSDDYRRRHPEIGDRRYLNVIAQEFRQVFPDAVKSSGEKLPNGDEILQVDTYPLTIYSAAAVQELHRMLLERDRQLAQQATEISDLAKRVAQLESLSPPAAVRTAALVK